MARIALLDLPVEILQMIAEALYSRRIFQVLCLPRPEESKYSEVEKAALKSERHNTVGLAMTCKKLKAIALDVFFNKATFYFGAPEWTASKYNTVNSARILRATRFTPWARLKHIVGDETFGILGSLRCQYPDWDALNTSNHPPIVIQWLSPTFITDIVWEQFAITAKDYPPARGVQIYVTFLGSKVIRTQDHIDRGLTKESEIRLIFQQKYGDFSVTLNESRKTGGKFLQYLRDQMRPVTGVDLELPEKWEDTADPVDHKMEGLPWLGFPDEEVKAIVAKPLESNWNTLN